MENAEAIGGVFAYMTDFSEAERRVYNTIRANTTAEYSDWIDLDHLKIHLKEFDGSEIQQALHDLHQANLIEVNEGRYRPSDHERRIPHPGEILCEEQ